MYPKKMRVLSLAISTVMLGGLLMSCKPVNPSSSSPSAPDSSPPADNSGVNDLPPMTLKEEDWEIEGGSVKFENNEIKVEYGSTLWYKPYTASGPYAVQLTLKCDQKQGDMRVGAKLEGGRDAASMLTFAVMDKDNLMLVDSTRNVNMVNVQYNALEKEVKLRVDVYPSSNTMIYYLNGKFAGELNLNAHDDPDLQGGRIALTTSALLRSRLALTPML